MVSFFLFIMIIAAYPAHAADSAVIPLDIQQGATPERTIEALKGIFQLYSFPRSPSVPAQTPALEQSLRQAKSGVDSLFTVDAGLSRLNAQIKETVGIDVPVLARALWNGIVWLVQWVWGLVSAFLP